MTKATLVALASVVIAAGPAFAHGSRGHGGAQRVRSSVPHRLHSHHRFNHGHGVSVFVGAPVIGYGYGVTSVPEYVPPPPTYTPAYAPPSYAPSSSAPPSYPPPPMQTVIEFPTGRYLLQGDGMAEPYRWVWVENPPPAPPPPPAASTPEPPAVRHLDYYRWTDADGVTHLTDSIDRVPEKYRATAKSKT